MSDFSFTPPFPFEHRTSLEDLTAYQEAIDRDEVRELMNRWADEEETATAQRREAQRKQREHRQMQDTLSRMEASTEAMKSASMLNHKVWMTKQEAADYLGISPRTIDRKREAGKLKGYLVEGTTTFRFKKDDLDDLMG
ncbi:helix-turn-helix domain-containing protein [Ruficoccus amylovorans]|uniref:Helix-turn-helix domain-containing protein n=1 Tax=Ruficoccus amylovorans TaxID=1804625 RepID=A0A842HGA5_9BACT|nr:helix-turn-helix domain-containing protein [Ruficoccus amylovorans]MBC2594607.1 helix-turn-helix domain-containing protein [Ruficoccus amylovorans]